jgi:hypothetical protein
LTDVAADYRIGKLFRKQRFVHTTLLPVFLPPL